MAKEPLTSESKAACLTCRDSGWLVKTLDSVEKVVPCPDCHSRDKSEKLLSNAQIPPRYFDLDFDEFSARTKPLLRAKRRCRDFVEAFPEVPRGLLLVGPCGVGKTHLSAAILKALIREKMISGRFVDETEFLRRIQYSFGRDSRETERELLFPLLHVDLLVWDDLGTGRPTEWVAETIRTVLNHRYTYSKHTILSTNLPLQPVRKTELSVKNNSLVEKIGMGLYSRLMEMCEVVEIDGEDFRTEVHKPGLDFQEKTRDSH